MDQHPTIQKPTIALMVKPVGEPLKRLVHDPALDQIIIGRRSSSGWTGERLNINDKHMSRQHCRIYWDAGETRWMVEDLQSANGTVIGGAPVRESGPLADGMLLQMGMSMVRVEFIDEPPSHEELRRQHEEGFGEGADVEPQDATIIRSVGAFEPTGLPVESLESVDITDEPEAPSDTAFDSDGPMVHAEVDEEDAIATVVSSDEGAGSDGGPSSEAFAEDILDFSLPDDDQPAESAEATDAGGEQLDAEEAIEALLNDALDSDETQLGVAFAENVPEESPGDDIETLTRIDGGSDDPARAGYASPGKAGEADIDFAADSVEEDATTIGGLTSIPDLPDVTEFGEAAEDSTDFGGPSSNIYQEGAPENYGGEADVAEFDPFASEFEETIVDDRAAVPDGYDLQNSGHPLSSSGKRVVLKGMARELVDKKLIEAGQAADLQEDSQSAGVSFFRALADTQRAKFIEDIYAWVAKERNIELITTETEVFEQATEAPWLNYEQSREFGVIALASDDPNIARFACVDPFNIMTLDWVQRKSRRKPQPVLAPSPAVLGAIERVKNSANQMDEIGLVIDLNPEDERQIDTFMGEIDIPQMVNYFLHRASLAGASDVHVEPTEDRLLVRFRVNGILYEERSLSMAHALAIASRLKIMSGMNVAEKRRPQDGRIGVVIRGKPIDVRVSSFPTVHGEKVVMRLLDKSALRPSPELLGLLDRDLRLLKDKIQAPYGLIMISGPTGSGKTTTLYSCLGSIDKTEKNVLTVEDPVEYQMQGVHQMQVNSKIGLTFASGLRTILRQDPDVIMVGECRDAETAEMAIQAALTGHIVFSTIHTNDAIGVISRLIDMGIEPFLVSTALSMTIAQRLVREICPHCKTTVMGDEIINNLGKDGISVERLEQLGIDIDEDIDYAEGKGCKHCRFTGYSGRRAVFEVFELNEQVRSHIVSQNFSDSELRRMAHDSGMTTLIRHGLKLVDDEVTTFSEVMRVLGEAS